MATYENAAALFEAGNYDDAVAEFIEIYESGVMCEEIIQNIYDCFIFPNQDEFKDNFVNNNTKLTILNYEELPLDFIPVTEKKFYIYDRVQEQFLGFVDLGLSKQERHFESVCIAGTWDLRDLFPAMKAGGWRKYYINLENCESYFFSFLKLPDFTLDYLKDMVLFTEFKQMEQYFTEHASVYLPHIFCTNDDGKYREMVQRIHYDRLQNKPDTERNVFLSICIPSWNRGSLLLQTVKNLLALPYDAEVEIVISNNGSDRDKDGYNELREICDSRIRYFEFEKNQGYAANVRKVLELAKGDFAVLSSDEDMMLLNHFPLLLDDLWNHLEMGIITTTGVGPGFANKKVIDFEKGIQALSLALNLNYITGNVFNMKYFHSNNVMSRFDAMRGNCFLEYYAHCVLALFTCEHAAARESGIVLWDSQILSDRNKADQATNKSGGVSEFAGLESRLEQQNSSIELLQQALKLEPEELVQLTLERMVKTYYVLSITYCNHVRELLKKYHWIDICMMLYKNNIHLLNRRLEGFVKQQEVDVNMAAESVFFRWYNRKTIMECLPEEERVCEEKLCRQIALYYDAGKPIEEIDLHALRQEILHAQ